MLLQFWKNPEFIRHRRAELRRGRVIAVGSVVLVVCVLTIVICWASEESQLVALRNAQNSQSPWISAQRVDQFAHDLPKIAALGAYKSIMLMQFGVLTFWSLLACAQAVSREREHMTWDFQRTTRLKSEELLLGKLLGEPVLAYFIALCALPVDVALGLEARVRVSDILAAYTLSIASALFIGLAGLWLSNLFESKSRGIGMIGAVAMYALFLGTKSLASSPFPGLAGFSPLTLLLPDPLRRGDANPTVFGAQIPWLLMASLLYFTFGAWLVLMLLRNLKKDFREVSLLSRWQAVGCCAFLNFVFYALFNPSLDPELLNGTAFITFMVGVNLVVLFALGLTMLSSSERLHAKDLFSLRSSFAEHSLAWPWLLISALASYFLLLWGLFAWKNVLEFSARVLLTAAISLFVVLIFVTRDVLFIQWCKLTRLRAPLIKGILYLSLYYAAVVVVCVALAVHSDKSSAAAANVLAPAAAFNHGMSLLNGTLLSGILDLSVVTGIVVQLMVVGFLISSIRRRTERTIAPTVA